MWRLIALLVLALSVSSCLKTDERFRAQGLAAIAVQQHAAGDLRGARETIALANEMLPTGKYGKDSTALLSIAWARARIGDVADARRTLNGRSGQSGGLVMAAFGQFQSGDNDGARETLTLALDSGVESGDDRMFTALLLGLLGDFEAAVSLVDSPDSDDEEMAVTAALIAAMQAQAGDLAGMQSTLSRLRQRVSTTKDEYAATPLLAEGAVRALAGDRARLADLKILIEQRWIPLAAGDAQELRKTRAIIEKVWLIGLALADLTDGKRESAISFLLRAAKAGAEFEDIVPVDYLIAGLMAYAGDLPRARETGEVLPEFAPGIALLLEVIATAALTQNEERDVALTAIGNFEAKIRKLAASDAWRQKPGESEFALAELAHMRLLLDDHAGAVESLNELGRYGGESLPIHATTITKLLSGDVAGAVREQLEFRAEGSGQIWENMPVIGHVAVLNAKAGDMEAARRMLFRTARLSEVSELMERAVGIFAWLKDYERAREAAQTVADSRSRTAILLELAKIAEGETNLAEMRQAIRLALEAASAEEDADKRRKLLLEVAKEARSVREFATSEDAMGRAAAAALDEPVPSVRIQRLLSVAKEQAKRGRKDMALATAKKAIAALPDIEAEEHDRMGMTIAFSLTDHGDLSGALALVESLNSPLMQTRALRRIADKLASQEKGIMAQQIMAKAVLIANGYLEPRMRSAELSQIAEAQTFIGPADVALATADRAMQAMRMDVSYLSHLDDMATIGVAYWRSGAVAKADQTFRLALSASSRITDPAERIRSLLKISKLIGETGMRGMAGEALTLAWAATSELKDVKTRDRLEHKIRCAREPRCGRRTPKERKEPKQEDPRPLAIGEPTMDPYDAPHRLLAQALEYAKAGDVEAAQTAADEAATRIGELKDPALKALGLIRLSQVRKAAADPRSAEEVLWEAVAIARLMEPSWLQMSLFIEAAETQLATDKWDSAATLAGEAVESFQAFQYQY